MKDMNEIVIVVKKNIIKEKNAIWIYSRVPVSNLLQEQDQRIIDKHDK